MLDALVATSVALATSYKVVVTALPALSVSVIVTLSSVAVFVLFFRLLSSEAFGSVTSVAHTVDHWPVVLLMAVLIFLIAAVCSPDAAILS